MEKVFLCMGRWCETYTMCQRCPTAPPSGSLFCWRRPGNLAIPFILWALQTHTSIYIVARGARPSLGRNQAQKEFLGASHLPLALVTSCGLLLRVYEEQAKLQAIDEAF